MKRAKTDGHRTTVSSDFKRSREARSARYRSTTRCSRAMAPEPEAPSIVRGAVTSQSALASFRRCSACGASKLKTSGMLGLIGLLIQGCQFPEVRKTGIQPASFQPGIHRTLSAVALDRTLGTLVGVAGRRTGLVYEVHEDPPAFRDRPAAEIVLRG